MIMAKDSNNNYVKIEDIIPQQNNFNGISPIKFKSSGENLENYRIYGNTVGGESVGDRTGNLFDKNDPDILDDYEIQGTNIVVRQEYFVTNFISVNAETSYITNRPDMNGFSSGVLEYDSSKQLIRRNPNSSFDGFTTTNTTAYIKLNGKIEHKDTCMLVKGNTVPSIYEPYGYKVLVTVEGKNLLQNTATSQTINGVTFTVNNDGSITCNGTATASAPLVLSIPFTLPIKLYELSGCPDSGSNSTYRVDIRNIDYSIYKYNGNTVVDDGTGCLFDGGNNQYCIRIAPGYTCNNLTFYPMIRKADIEDGTYEPYHAPITTSIYLPEQIRKVDDEAEYIDFEEQKQHFADGTSADVTLPALPTFLGTNTLSVETNTKPSKVWGKLSDPKDILYVKDNLRNILFSKYHEIEGEHPLIYKAKKAGTLIDYRIYGQTVDGESVGDRTGNLFDETIYDKNVANNTLIYIPIYVGNVNYVTCSTTCPKTITDDYDPFNSRYIFILSGNVNTGAKNDENGVSNGAPRTIQPSNGYVTICYRKIESYNVRPWEYQTMLNSGSTALPYEPYGYKVPVTVEGKNLLQNTAKSQTINGVTFTVNSDGSVTCNGTSTSQYYSLFRIPCYLVAGEYIISGCPVDGGSSKYRADIRISPDGGMVGGDADIGAGTTIPIDESGWYDYTIRIQGGYTVDDVVFKPMIRKADIEDDTYEPYHAPVTTTIYLPEQIKKVGDEAEYIDYGTQKQHKVRKNLLRNTAESQTINGVTFTVNADGSITCSGILTSDAYVDLVISGVFLGDTDILEDGNYVVSCGNGSNNAYLLVGDSEGELERVRDAEINISANFTWAMLRIRQADPAITLYPMIRKADITDDAYEPYIENTDLDVTLPALPTLSGTNTLSVGTEVQPSKVYIKGKLKRTIYGWHVNPDISDSSNAVTYLKDAIGMTPASMGSTTFDYGSWENAFFMPKPCMLKSNGKVDYYLDPNDYTKKLNGTASDISNPNYDGNAMMQWPKIWFKYVKGVKEGQGYFYVANYKADGNYHCWCNYDSENNEIDHFYTAIYNGTSFMDYKASKTYVVNDFAVYDNKLYKRNTAKTAAQAFDSAKWNVVSNTAPAINKMRSLSGIRLTNNNGNAQTNTTTEVTRATANNTTSATEWYIETFSDRLLINGLLVLMGKSLNTQAVFGRGLDTGGQFAKEDYVTGTLNDKGLFWGVTENGNSGVKVFGMENFWGCCWHRTAGLIINNHAVKLKLTYGKKDGSAIIGYNQTGHGYINNETAPYSNGYVQKMSYNKYGFMPAVVTGGSQSTYYADYYYQNATYTGIIYALFGGRSADGLDAGSFSLSLNTASGSAHWSISASLSCKPLLT